MRLPACRASLAALAIPLLLSGCSLLPTTRRLPVPKAPAIVQTVTPQQLVDNVDARWDALKTLNATVDIELSVLKAKEGVTSEYPSFRGHILMRKPRLLRVLGLYPVLGTKMFDMASDGKTFTLLIPYKNKAVEGADTVNKISANKLENIRPSVFFDALVVRGLDPDDFYSVTADSETVEDLTHKHLLQTPEYVLRITRHKPGSREEIPVREITFHREDLLPYQQDIYDPNGNLETVVDYSAYHLYEGTMYPSTITIRRPLEDYKIVMTVEKVIQNMTLPDDQFEVKIPAGTDVQVLQ